MTDVPTNDQPSGSDHKASGDNQESDNFVKYDTYSRVLGEAKTFKSKYRDALAELNDYKQKEQSLAEEKMLEEKKYSELIETLKTQNQQLASRVDSFQKEKVDFNKMTAALSVLQSKGINLEQKYLGLLPIDEIEVTEDGSVDHNSLTSVLDSFQKEHPRLTMPAAKIFPNDKSADSRMISVDEWKKLPKDEKRKALLEKRVKA